MLLNDDKVLVIFGKIITQKRKMGIRAIQIYKQSNNDNDNEKLYIAMFGRKDSYIKTNSANDGT